ncbi:hypothetical protein FA95DRAFT_1530745 [Auriscalpium vulgare]|uniref:Uncharacterized protein n=1 Tax=Auriscalpium vulgare TaxID=40419 RepID=A0ACB8SC35_9AGAM|nr:hypothetical protein FA95DRAFT_1530745 [Auriscalpium vulgare]
MSLDASASTSKATALPTPAQIFAWTLTKDAIAPCFVRDVNHMEEPPHSGSPYYLIGRTPCRTVELVGTLVGLSAYDRRTVYLLDDGTGVIECALRHQSREPSGEHNAKPSSSRLQSNVNSSTGMQPPPAPFFPVGSTIRVVGRVNSKSYAKDIQCESIERCPSNNDELDHWRKVIKLHRDSYRLSKPFIVPAVKPTTELPTVPSTPRKDRSKNDATPSKPGHVLLSAMTTPSHSTPSTSATTSPAKSVSESTSSPPRLKHPSRLHSRALTANTFRIYVKHYMDNYSQLSPSCPSHDALDSESETDSISYALARAPSTPTKRPRKGPGDKTPRQFKMGRALDSPDATPRSKHPPPSLPRDSEDLTNRQVGFTISYLRRVPELSTLARRVVDAEVRRRAKEEQGKTSKSSQSSSMKGKENARPPSRHKEAAGPKMKRLFEWAIRELFKEGSVIIWDGPVISLPASLSGLVEASRMWRTNDTTADVTSSSIASTRCFSQDDNDDGGVLSDPDASEDSYIPLSSAYLARQVQAAIKALMLRKHSEAPTGTTNPLAPAVSRARKFAPPGPTKEEITTYIRRSDGRWDRVGVWAVSEAIDWLHARDKIWRVSEDDGGRWELVS